MVARTTDVEIFVNNNWVSLTDPLDVRSSDAITITHGSSSESGRADPSECALTLDNPGRKYDPFNPNGPYYGSIGQNTPLRVATALVKDRFTRTLANTWGDAAPGFPYALTGFNNPQFADWNVNGTTGTVRLPTADSARNMELDDVKLVDVEQAATVTMQLGSVTGSTIFPLWLLSRVSADFEYVAAVLSWDTDGQVSVSMYRRTASGSLITIRSPEEVGITFAVGTSVRMKSIVDGHSLWTKVWRPTNPEPKEWQYGGDISAWHQPGGVAIRSSVNPGNTNTYPITVTIDDYEVRSLRHTGEIAELPQRRHDNDAYIPVVSAGIRRRLLQGRSPTRSTMREGYLSKAADATALAAYWPCEEGKNSVQLNSDIGGPPMSVIGDTDFGVYSEFPSSAPIPKLGATSWSGAVPKYTAVNNISLRWLMTCVSGQTTDHPIIAIHTQSSNWGIMYMGGGGDLKVQAYSPFTGALLHDSGIYNWNADDVPMMCQLDLNEVGGSIEWKLATLQLDATAGSAITGTLSGTTLGLANRVVVSQWKDQFGLAIGQIAVRKGASNIFVMQDEFDAYNGLLGGYRIFDILVRGGIDIQWLGDLANTQRVGYQRFKTLLELADEAAAADGGAFLDSRSWAVLKYHPLRTRYNRPVFLTLDYAAEEVSAPFEPLKDDEGVTNDVTVTRVDGGEVTAELSQGPMSVLPPGQGGVGRYDSKHDLLLWKDTQLMHVASWKLHVGTVNERRYPSVTVDLGNLAAGGKDMLALSLEVDDRLRILNAPDSDGPIDLLVRGYTETIYPFGTHTIEFYCEPASAYDVLRPDIPGSNRVSGTGSTVPALVTTTATTFNVDTLAGKLWFDPVAPDTYDMNLGGEIITVTDVAPVSATRQSLTVTRSVNGVIKQHLAGTPIRLHRRATVPL